MFKFDHRSRPGIEAAPRSAIHVVDDDPPVCDALSAFLRAEGFAVVTHGSGTALLDGLDGQAPDCVVMDVRMPGRDGISIYEELHRRLPEVPVILITGDGDIPLAVAALKAGVRDFLEKPFAPEALLDSIAQALAALPVPSPDRVAARETVGALTHAEHRVLRRMLLGETNKEIARRLGNSPRTIEVHRARLMAKLGANSLAEALRTALAAGVDARDG